MKIRINGEIQQIEGARSVAELLEKLNVSQKGIAIELNQAVICKEAWLFSYLKEGDALEIVQFVGGGF